MLKLKVFFEESKRVAELEQKNLELHHQIEILKLDIRNLQFKYGNECNINMALCDILRSNGIPFPTTMDLLEREKLE